MQSSLWRFGGGFFLALCASAPAVAGPMQWEYLRDGTLHLRPQGGVLRHQARLRVAGVQPVDDGQRLA